MKQTTLKITEVKLSNNYRKTMDKASFKELVESIKSKGVLQPLLE